MSWNADISFEDEQFEDREHGHIYRFGRDNNAEYFISSDLMTRNLNRRMEIVCPTKALY